MELNDKTMRRLKPLPHFVSLLPAWQQSGFFPSPSNSRVLPSPPSLPSASEKNMKLRTHIVDPSNAGSLLPPLEVVLPTGAAAELLLAFLGACQRLRLDDLQ